MKCGKSLQKSGDAGKNGKNEGSFDDSRQVLVCDLVTPGQEYVIIRGSIGGKEMLILKALKTDLLYNTQKVPKGEEKILKIRDKADS